MCQIFSCSHIHFFLEIQASEHAVFKARPSVVFPSSHSDCPFWQEQRIEVRHRQLCWRNSVNSGSPVYSLHWMQSVLFKERHSVSKHVSLAVLHSFLMTRTRVRPASSWGETCYARVQTCAHKGKHICKHAGFPRIKHCLPAFTTLLLLTSTMHHKKWHTRFHQLSPHALYMSVVPKRFFG